MQTSKSSRLLDLPTEVLSLIYAPLSCLAEMRLLATTKRLAARAEETKEARRLSVRDAFDSLVARVPEGRITTVSRNYKVHFDMKYNEEDKLITMKERTLTFETYWKKTAKVCLEIKWHDEFLRVHIERTRYFTITAPPPTNRYKDFVIYPHRGTLLSKGHRSNVERPVPDLFAMLEMALDDLR